MLIVLSTFPLLFKSRRGAGSGHSQPSPSLSESSPYGSEPVTWYVTPGCVYAGRVPLPAGAVVVGRPKRQAQRVARCQLLPPPPPPPPPPPLGGAGRLTGRHRTRAAVLEAGVRSGSAVRRVVPGVAVRRRWSKTAVEPDHCPHHRRGRRERPHRGSTSAEPADQRVLARPTEEVSMSACPRVASSPPAASELVGVVTTRSCPRTGSRSPLRTT